MENKRFELNKNLAQMLKGGVIMDVTTPEQAKIAEAAGARVLARVDGKIVAAREGNQLAVAFHPELTDDLRVHRYFLGMVNDALKEASAAL